MKLIIHNVRSCHNVGSLFRSADAFSVSEIILTGYSPHPKLQNDTRLPHVAERAHRQISKTALGAEENVKFSVSNLNNVIDSLHNQGVKVFALEQTKASLPIEDFRPRSDFAIAVGEERSGFSDSEIALFDASIEIPMFGQKESLNVSVAGAIAMYELSNRTAAKHKKH